MYAFATAGSQPNNDEFSPASRTMMNNVIAVRGQGQGMCVYVCVCTCLCK